MNAEAIAPAVFVLVFLPVMYRLFTYPRILFYREQPCHDASETLVVITCRDFWGKKRKVFSDDSGRSFFYADTLKSSDIHTAYWCLKLEERRKAFIEKEGLSSWVYPE